MFTPTGSKWLGSIGPLPTPSSRRGLVPPIGKDVQESRVATDPTAVLGWVPLVNDRRVDPATAPLLLTVELPNGDAADAFTDQGLVELGLPLTYPSDANGDAIPHTTCQPIGQTVFDAELDGVDCRSAAYTGRRELAWFTRTSRAHELPRRGFEKWW